MTYTPRERYVMSKQVTYKMNLSSRIPELDVLRGTAIILVICRHVLIIPDILPPVTKTVFRVLREMGWIGVDLFFVLSGFLVSGLLFSESLKTGRVRVGRFLIRRGFKIYPSFYVLIVFSLIFSQLFSIPNYHTSWSVFGEIFFVQNYIAAMWDHTPTLAVEEHFYLLLAGIFLVLSCGNNCDRLPFAFLKTIVAITAFLILTWRAVLVSKLTVNDWHLVHAVTHFRIDSLFFGVYLAYLYHYERQKIALLVHRYVPLLVLLGFSAFATPLIFQLGASRFIYSFGYPILYIGFGSILLLALLFPLKGKGTILRCLHPLTWIGQRSYSIYLWHMMVYHFSIRLFPPNESCSAFYIQTSAYIIGSIAIGALMATIIELPMLRIRDKYFP